MWHIRLIPQLSTASRREEFERRWEERVEEERIKDLWLSQEEEERKKEKTHIPEMFSVVLERDGAHKCRLARHTRKHTETPTRLKIGQKQFPCWNKK